MLMITVEPDAAALVLRLDGRLAGLEARELAANWNTLPFKQPDQRVVFDLTRVTFVDRAGLEFLAKAHRSGDSLIGGATTTSIVEQIIAGIGLPVAPDAPAGVGHGRVQRLSTVFDY